jgi:hypothetical protein
MEIKASNYVVLLDGNKDLDEGHGETFKAKKNDLSSQFDRTASPILWLNIQPLTSHRLKFIVVLNDPAFTPDNIDESKLVLTYDVPDDIRVLRSIHEVLAVKLFISGDDNLFRFHVVAGKVRLSDIVLFFHVKFNA